MLALLRRWFGRGKAAGGGLPEAKFQVVVDEAGVQVRTPAGQEAALGWDELVGVAIQTTDGGPFEPDVFWVLGAQEYSLRIPQGAQGDEALLSRLQSLPGFDNEAVVAAMGSTGNDIFVCWQRQAAQA